MEKFVPYAKMSKKLKKQTDRARRNTWGPLDPVTRVKKSGKLYDRKRARRRDDDRMGAFLFAFSRPGPVFVCISPHQGSDRPKAALRRSIHG